MIHAEFFMVEFRCCIMSSECGSRRETCSCNKYIILFTFFLKKLWHNCNSLSHTPQQSFPPKRIIYTILQYSRDSELLFIFTQSNLTKNKYYYLYVEGLCTTPYPCKPHHWMPKLLQGGTFSLLSHMYVHTQLIHHLRFQMHLRYWHLLVPL